MMKIEGTPKEIADFVLQLQNQLYNGIKINPQEIGSVVHTTKNDIFQE